MRGDGSKNHKNFSTMNLVLEAVSAADRETAEANQARVLYHMGVLKHDQGAEVSHSKSCNGVLEDNIRQGIRQSQRRNESIFKRMADMRQYVLFELPTLKLHVAFFDAQLYFCTRVTRNYASLMLCLRYQGVASLWLNPDSLPKILVESYALPSDRPVLLVSSMFTLNVFIPSK